ncbi:MAG: hypothetical protein KTR14_09005 [Vampirovibrio sp.]|nr:hypothetical protein [Vampirovibrio sp.]
MSAIQDTLTTLRNDTNRINFENGLENRGSGKLDKNAFLQLLLAQLQYQNPLEPVDNTEFIGQQAQFTQIEKLDELNANIEKSNQISNASTMVGKFVEILQEDGSSLVGKVDSVVVTADEIGLNVDGQLYPPGSVFQIFSEDPGIAAEG